MRWMRSAEQEFVLAGYAGTGKSTLANRIASEVSIEKTAFAAYTGKAVNVLRAKGNYNTRTLHSWIYALGEHDKAILKELQAQLHTASKQADAQAVRELTSLIEAKRAQMRKPVFEPNMDSELTHAKLVIVDEYSMLDEKLVADLRKVAKKILYLGDPGQLPPVHGKCPLKPEVFLTEVHRQALDSGIIKAATAARKGEPLPIGNHGDFDNLAQGETTPQLYLDADQLIVGRNITRASWNMRFRRLLNHTDEHAQANDRFPKIGEKLICLKNNPFNALYNGSIVSALSDAHDFEDEHYTLNVCNESGDALTLSVWSGDVLGSAEKYDGYNEYHRRLARFDFGYAITCHKSQGSEFENVVIYNEPIGKTADERRRWLYTAITRGGKKVTLVRPERKK